MKTRLLPFLFAFALAPLQPVPAQVEPGAAAAWRFDRSDLIPDPTVRFGVLPNGMRYAIMKNAKPQHSASIRLRFAIGSVMESEAQRGIAHFLEHMAFNGSTHVPEGEMVKLLERKGLAFGADTNASTGFTETVYKLDLPQVSDDLVDTGLFLMREVAGELKLDPGAIDRERGIILGEKRARDNYSLRSFIDVAQFFVPGTPVSKGLPIGSEQVIRTAKPAAFRDLYERYYTPSRATLVIVGDFDPAAIEAKIRARFSNWKARGPAGPDVPRGAIDADRPGAAHLFVDKDVPTSATLALVKPYDNDPDTRARRARDLVTALGNAIVNRRIARLQADPVASFTSGSASTGPFVSTATLSSVSVSAKDRDWKAALGIGERELRRALQFGFTQSEIDEQLAALRRILENAVAQAPTRNSSALAEGLVATLEDTRIFTTPQSALDRFNALAPTITPETVTAAFRKAWSGGNMLVHVANNEAIEGGEPAIEQAWRESAKVAVAAPGAGTAKAFAYTDFGPPGTIAEDRRVADLDIREIRFANNVRLNLKRTDFEKGRVRVSLRIGGGAAALPAQPDGLAMFMHGAFSAGGTSAHSVDDLRSILAGRTVSGNLGAGSDAFGGGYATVPQDLELQLQLLAAMVTAPGYRAEGEAQWRNQVGVIYPTLDSQPAAIVGRDVARILASGDTRFGLPKEADAKARGYAELKPLVESALAHDAIEIGIVGDVDEAAAIAAVAKTFGALPPRAAERPDYGALRPVSFPASRARLTLTHSGKPNQAIALSYWPTTDGMDPVTEAQLTMLGRILQLLMTDELREKLGATYSPQAGSFASSLYRGYGYLSVSSNVEPGAIPAVNAAVDRVAARLGRIPLDADVMLRARKPLLEAIERSRRENSAWIGLIDEAQSQPRDLDDFRTQAARISAVTPAQIRALAQRYLTPGAELRIGIVPREGAQK